MRVVTSIIAVLVASLSFAEPVWVLKIDGVAQGEVKINLREDLAPKHVERIIRLTNEGQYNNIVFHRVIDGFMAQSGDVEYGRLGSDVSRAGRGGSSLDDLPAEFSSEAFEKGVVGMARSQSPNSANSQFFIMLAPGRFLDGQYTVFGEVIEGHDVVDAIKRGDPNRNGSVESPPDYIVEASIEEGS